MKHNFLLSEKAFFLVFSTVLVFSLLWNPIWVYYPVLVCEWDKTTWCDLLLLFLLVPVVAPGLLGFLLSGNWRTGLWYLGTGLAASGAAWILIGYLF